MKTLLLTALFFQMFFSIAQDKATLEVFVTSIDNSIKPNEKVEFVAIKTNKTFLGITDSNGKFSIELPGGDTYKIEVTGIGETRDYSTIAIPALKQNEKYGIFKLNIAFDLPKQFILKNLHFDVGKATIRSGSYTELNDLVELMTLKPNIRIRIEGHTDSDGDDDSNLKLSKSRAYTVQRYLISKGISASRLISEGYGETRPIASNNSASGKQQNRRTEIHFIE